MPSLNNPGKRRWLLLPLAASALIGAVFVVSVNRWRSRQPSSSAPSPPSQAFPMPPYSESPYLNTGPDAQYIGTSACVRCHQDKHASYALTTHSRALNDINPQAEPPDGSFDHRPSGRSYRVYRQGHQLRHQEVVRTQEGQEIARVDLPIR